ncbi:unnamed protein product [Calypogeia fissa]
MASWATGMAMPVVSGPVVVMNAAKKIAKAKPKQKEENKNFLEQLGEWTQKSSLNETDPLLKKVADEKKGVVSGPSEERKKTLFGL